MISAARQVLGKQAGKRSSAPDELASSPAQECFARNLYHDRAHDIDAAKLLPGEYFVCTRDMLLVTVLGSCVAACIRDTRMGIGGMNHFMLPDSEVEQTEANGARYGTYAMEVLINHLLKLGARREHLEAKVFGGGNVLAGLTQANVGHKNATFVQSFLKEENIRIAARDLADVFPRKVYFFPASGKVLVKRLRTVNNATVAEREIEYRKRLTQAPESGEIELFN
jgi:chemotaxis protein CheD